MLLPALSRRVLPKMQMLETALLAVPRKPRHTTQRTGDILLAEPIHHRTTGKMPRARSFDTRALGNVAICGT